MTLFFKGGLQFAGKWSPFHQKSGLHLVSYRLFVVPKFVNISVYFIGGLSMIPREMTFLCACVVHVPVNNVENDENDWKYESKIK